MEAETRQSAARSWNLFGGGGGGVSSSGASPPPSPSQKSTFIGAPLTQTVEAIITSPAEAPKEWLLSANFICGTVYSALAVALIIAYLIVFYRYTDVGAAAVLRYPLYDKNQRQIILSERSLAVLSVVCIIFSALVHFINAYNTKCFYVSTTTATAATAVRAIELAINAALIMALVGCLAQIRDRNAYVMCVIAAGVLGATTASYTTTTPTAVVIIVMGMLLAAICYVIFSSFKNYGDADVDADVDVDVPPPPRRRWVWTAVIWSVVSMFIGCCGIIPVLRYYGIMTHTTNEIGYLALSLSAKIVLAILIIYGITSSLRAAAHLAN